MLDQGPAAGGGSPGSRLPIQCHRADHHVKMEETLLGWESLLVKEVLSNLNQVDQMVIFIGGGNRSEEVHKGSFHPLVEAPSFHVEPCFFHLMSEVVI